MEELTRIGVAIGSDL
jgi:CopG family transcriptional regulator, nickel-responsive regulator